MCLLPARTDPVGISIAPSGHDHACHSSCPAKGAEDNVDPFHQAGLDRRGARESAWALPRSQDGAEYHVREELSARGVVEGKNFRPFGTVVDERDVGVVVEEKLMGIPS